MPELPEVETICCGIRQHIVGKTISRITVHQRQLRWLVPANLSSDCSGNTISRVYRRAKYLLLETSADNTIIVHLGMSGSLCLATCATTKKHDHVEFIFGDNTRLVYNDPRRFGAVLLGTNPVAEHKLLRSLGPEPLSVQFDGRLLFDLAQKRKIAVKSLVMDGAIVVGVGNIYASEALFASGIHPQTPAGSITLARYQLLATRIKSILLLAIRQGGTTLKDFVNASGKPGYFQQSLQVYGRGGAPCVHCASNIELLKINGRSSYFCPSCQKL